MQTQQPTERLLSIFAAAAARTHSQSDFPHAACVFVRYVYHISTLILSNSGGIFCSMDPPRGPPSLWYKLLRVRM